MRIPYHIEIVEDYDTWLPCDDGRNETTIIGRVCDGPRILVRYLATWADRFPADSVTFDLIFVSDPSSHHSAQGTAVSVVYTGVDKWHYINSSKREFAKRQAIYCNFQNPIVATSDELEDLEENDDPDSQNELVVDTQNTANFIIEHDTRLAGCFGVLF
ncbi:MAG: hypothetical protein ACREBW_04365 [Candidatus Micrarchaeaceae archaeon]